MVNSKIASSPGAIVNVSTAGSLAGGELPGAFVVVFYGKSGVGAAPTFFDRVMKILSPSHWS